MTVAEKNVLAARGLSGVRLSCQILCDHDMEVRANKPLRWQWPQGFRFSARC